MMIRNIEIHIRKRTQALLILLFKHFEFDCLIHFRRLTLDLWEFDARLQVNLVLEERVAFTEASVLHDGRDLSLLLDLMLVCPMGEAIALGSDLVNLLKA